jgi:hypothetical protein
MGKPGGRSDHPVAIGAQRWEPPSHLARQALNATDLGADGGACVDRDDGRVRGVGHRYCGRTVRRSTSPQPSRPTPIATSRPMSTPVRGRVDDVDGSAELVDDDALVVVALEADVEVLDEDVAAGAVDELEDVELGADGWVLVVLEPDFPPEPEELEPPSGSTYCWSPAEPPPPAMAAAGASIARAAIATTRPRIWRRRLTRRVLHPGRRGRRGPASA